MRNKFTKDFVIVIFAYLLASSLIARLIGMIVYGMLPSNDLGVAVVVWAAAFALSYFGAWYFFNEWKAKFWIKVCTAVGVIILSRAAFTLVDMNTIFNMSHR